MNNGVAEKITGMWTGYKPRSVTAEQHEAQLGDHSVFKPMLVMLKSRSTIRRPDRSSGFKPRSVTVGQQRYKFTGQVRSHRLMPRSVTAGQCRHKANSR